MQNGLDLLYRRELQGAPNNVIDYVTLDEELSRLYVAEDIVPDVSPMFTTNNSLLIRGSLQSTLCSLLSEISITEHASLSSHNPGISRINLVSEDVRPQYYLLEPEYDERISPVHVNPPSSQNARNNRNNTARSSSGGVKSPFRLPRKKGVHCSFCYSNQSQVYDHYLKKKCGTRTVVLCPVLRKFVCPKCGATGDNAHTITYCPKTIKEYGFKPVSVAKLLLSSSRNSCGRKRNVCINVNSPFQ